MSDTASIIVDFGSGNCKVGFSGEKEPRVVSVPKGKSLVDRGTVPDWDAWKNHLKSAFKDLNVSADKHPILLTRPPISSKEHTEKLVEIILESFGAPAMYVANEAVLSLYAAGRLEGIVCGIGEGLSYTVPVHEGFAVDKAAHQMNYAGRDLDALLKESLIKKESSLGNLVDFDDIVRDVKEKLCYVSLNYEKESLKSSKESYTLPDSQVLTIEKERYLCPEALFQPSLLGMKSSGIGDATFDSIKKCDEAIQPGMCSNLVLSGGSTLFAGFAKRLQREVSGKESSLPKIEAISLPSRKIGAWIGASVLAVHDNFQSMWLTNKEFEENGFSIAHKKFA